MWQGDTAQNEGVFNVYGHTPTPEPDIAKFSANIDTSRVYKHELGCLCALESEYADFYAGKYRGRRVRLLGQNFIVAFFDINYFIIYKITT